MTRAALRRWLQRRSRRERLLALVAALVVVGSVVDTLVFAPLRTQEAALRKQLVQARHALQEVQAQAQMQTEQSDAQASARSRALAARRQRAEDVIRAAQADLIAPQNMARQLSTILARHPQLRVVTMSTQTPTPVGEAASGTGGAPAAPSAVVGLYQHGLELRVEGRYLDVLAWLAALENAPYRIYWREFELQVGNDGMPITRIAFFTLSREAVWLRL